MNRRAEKSVSWLAGVIILVVLMLVVMAFYYALRGEAGSLIDNFLGLF